MKSLEREIIEYLYRHGVEFSDNGTSYTDPDFLIYGKNGAKVWVEVKEKRQKYDVSVWPIEFPEHYAFILDELTARKLMQYATDGALIVRDNTTGLYYFADPFSLWLMDRTRCIRNHGGYPKGKWVLDLRQFMGSDRLSDMFVFLRDHLQEAPGLVGRDAALHRPDLLEEIITAGTPRTEEQKEYDVKATR